jgi:hypothetical protein
VGEGDVEKRNRKRCQGNALVVSEVTAFQDHGFPPRSKFSGLRQDGLRPQSRRQMRETGVKGKELPQ